ncbi:hypothetical protein [Candidatus Uabimicrobium amorphum]|uniref:Uncharacterized protein n=1 Tax=Uabimicrobium amorphum TaxID=2596890 RepID=A0A5S9IP57_UABAM|nr:hypothetical protein [Candidatus Uabimicrobium amorphum]BBM85314.1 hypothetical protein UABAM_03680 [Candidatus Uabimicrobium amorphum]
MKTFWLQTRIFPEIHKKYVVDGDVINTGYIESSLREKQELEPVRQGKPSQTKISNTDQIMNRIRKVIDQQVENNERTKNSEKEKEKMNLRLQKMQKINKEVSSYPTIAKKHYSIQLTTDLARMREAIHLEFVSREQMLDIFLSFCKKSEIPCVSNYIYQNKFIRQHQYKILQKVHGKTIHTTEKPYEINKVELLLAEKLCSFEILSHKQVQTALRILIMMNSLGIGYSFDALLIESKLVGKQIVYTLIDGISSKAKQNKQVASIQRKRPVLFSFIRVTVILYSLFAIALLFTFHKMNTPPQRRFVKNFSSEKPTKRSQDESGKKNTQQQIVQRKLPTTVKWGKFVLKKAQADVLQKSCHVGSISPVRIFVSGFNIEYQKNLSVAWSIQLQKLPKSMPLRVVSLLTSISGEKYADVITSCCESQKFKTKFLLHKKVEPGFYRLQVNILPQLQSDFLRYFLGLQKPYTWTRWVQIGSLWQIQQLRRNQINKLKAFSQRISSVYHKWKETGKKPESEIRFLQNRLNKDTFVFVKPIIQLKNLLKQLDSLAIDSEKENLSFQIALFNFQSILETLDDKVEKKLKRRIYVEFRE